MVSSPARTGLAVICAAVWLLAAAGGATAASIGNPYESTVATGGAGEADAFRNALADVLIRVTGRRDAPGLQGLAPLVADASRYVSSYRRAAAGRMTVTFDGDAIEHAIVAAGLPFWGDQRPLTLVWLAVDRGAGQRGLVTAEAASSERKAVELAAAQRGLPIAWPSAAAGEDVRRHFDQAWSGDTTALASAAGRYGAEGVLVGRAVSTSRGAYSVDWYLQAAGNAAELRGGLEDGVHAIADRYASLYASASAARRTELVVTIQGVSTIAQYAETMRYLESLSVVRGLLLQEVQQEAVVFRLSVRGDLAALQREVAAGGRLARADGGAGTAVFTYRP
jgi:hypothetical protein